MTYIIIKIPSLQLLVNEFIADLSNKSRSLGATVQGSENGITTYGNIGNNALTYSLLTYDVVKSIVDLGGNVLNYQSYIEVDLSANVPTYIRGSQETDIDGVITNNTWQEWLHPNQPVITLDNKTYVSGFGNTAGFKTADSYLHHLDGIELTALVADEYVLLNKNEFQILQASFNTD
jgi:hypothetical protein